MTARMERRTRALSETHVETLLAEFGHTRSTAARDTLVLQFSGLVENTARNYLRSGESLDDLIQEGYLGLLRAVDLYDRERGVKFVTYASHMVEGAIKHYLRDRRGLIREPGWLHELSHRVHRTIEELSHRRGRYPTVTEIAEELNVEEEAVLETLRTRPVFQVGSLSTAGPDNGSEGERLDSLVVEEGSLEPDALPLEERMVLDKAMSQLKALEREVIEYFFFKDLSQTEIAKQLGVSCNYVSHLVRMALYKMRRSLGREEQREASLRLRASIKRRQDYLRALEQGMPRDALTGLPPRSFLIERLREEIAFAHRYAHEVGLVLFDVDGLDHYNGTVAPAAGDAALRRIGALLRRSLRKVDIIGRFDDDVFAAILPHTGATTQRVAERLVRTVAQERIGAVSRRGKYVTVRAGVAVFPLCGLTEDELIAAALAAVAQAKEDGGNRVVAAPPAQPLARVETTRDEG